MNTKLHYRRRKNLRWTDELEMELLEDVITNSTIIDGCIVFAARNKCSSIAAQARYYKLVKEHETTEEEEWETEESNPARLAKGKASVK